MINTYMYVIIGYESSLLSEPVKPLVRLATQIRWYKVEEVHQRCMKRFLPFMYFLCMLLSLYIHTTPFHFFSWPQAQLNNLYTMFCLVHLNDKIKP